MTEIWSNAWETWSAGGPLLIPLAITSMGVWAYFLRSQSRMNAIARECRNVERQVVEQGLEIQPTGPVGTLLLRIREDIAAGTPPRQAFHERSDATLDALHRDIVILSALTAIAPLLGLLGTVQGMIATFTAVADVAGNTGVKVAGGISQALITTQFGLVVALPGVFGVSRLRSILRSLEAQLGSLRAASLPHVEPGYQVQAA